MLIKTVLHNCLLQKLLTFMLRQPADGRQDTATHLIPLWCWSEILIYLLIVDWHQS